jgi:hypothetical protein
MWVLANCCNFLKEKRRMRATALSVLSLVLIVSVVQVIAMAASKPKVEVEVIYLRDQGFTPKAITRSAGQFVLVIENRSRTQTNSIGLTRSDGAASIAPNVSTDHSHSFVLNLPAGQYKLGDSSHAAWSQVTITLK